MASEDGKILEECPHKRRRMRFNYRTMLEEFYCKDCGTIFGTKGPQPRQEGKQL